MNSLETRITRLERIVGDPSVHLVAAPDTATLREAMRDARREARAERLLGVITGVPPVTEETE
jgi:hypothetical protein